MSASEHRAATIDTDENNERRFCRVARYEAFSLLFIVLVGAAFRLYHIGWQPLWFDEAFSEWASRQSVSYLWSVLPTFETNPPLYYALLKEWRALFGDSEAALRSLSALFGTATIPVVYAMGRMLGGHRSGPVSGLMAAAIFALSPIHVQYAQEARVYAMLVFGVALAMSGLMWLILNPAQICAWADRSGSDKGGQRTPWVIGVFALGMALIMWSHDTGAFAVLAMALPGVYWWATDAKRCPRALIGLLLAGAVAFALLLPYLGHLTSHMGTVNKSFWIEAPTWSTLTDVVTGIYGTPTKEGFSVFVVFWSLGVFAIHALWQRGMRSIALLLVSVGLVPVLLELLVSFLAMPIFLDRTLLYANVPLYVAAGYAITQLPIKSGVAAAIVVSMLGIALGSYYRDSKKEPWNEIAAYLSSSLQPGEPVLLLPSSLFLPLEYYAVRQGAEFRQVGVPFDWRNPRLAQPTPDDRPPRTKIESTDMDRISPLIGRSNRVGLLMRRSDLVDPKLLVKQEVMKTHDITEIKQFQNITVIMFEARGNTVDRTK